MEYERKEMIYHIWSKVNCKINYMESNIDWNCISLTVEFIKIKKNFLIIPIPFDQIQFYCSFQRKKEKSIDFKAQYSYIINLIIYRNKLLQVLHNHKE